MTTTQEILNQIRKNYEEMKSMTNEEDFKIGSIEEYAVSISRAIFEEFKINEWHDNKNKHLQN